MSEMMNSVTLRFELSIDVFADCNPLPAKEENFIFINAIFIGANKKAYKCKY